MIAQRPGTRTAACAAALVVAATAIVIAGISLWPIVIVSTATLWWALSTRVGRLAALGVAAMGSSALILGLLLLSAATGAPPVAVLTTTYAGLGLSAVRAIARSPRPASHESPDLSALWVPALLGPVIWMATFLTSATSGSVGRLAWAMTGDSPTYLSYARSFMLDGGIVPGASQSPVPLPSALIAVGAWAGRGSQPAADLLRHDLDGLVVAWSLLVAATCFTAGLAAALTIGTRHPRLAAAAGAIGSILPLSWFVTGYAIEFGFINAHVVLPVLFLSWAVVVGSRRSDVAVLLTLMLATTVLLATWTPAALVPVALGAVVVGRCRGALVSTPARRIAVGVGVAQGVVCTVVIVIPGLLAHGGALSTDGAVYPLPVPVVLGTLIAALSVAWFARRAGDPRATWIVAVTVASAAAVGALVLVNVGQPVLWNYYPVKLAWLVCLLALVVLVPTLVRLVAASGRPATAAGVGAALVLTTAAALTQASGAIHDRSTLNPLVRVMASGAGTGRQVSDIIAGTDADRPSILWATGQDSEDDVNYWILQDLAGPPTDERPLFRLSYDYRPGNIDDLCEIIRLVPRPLTIRTGDPALSGEIARACGGRGAQVVPYRPS